MKKFQVTNSTYVNIVTYGLGLIFLSLIWLMLQKSLFSGDRIGALPLLGAILIILIGLYFFANSPKQILVDKEFVTIDKNIGKVEIPRRTITKAGNLANKELRLTTGSLGFFGFIGKSMGNSQSYVKDRGQMVKLETTQGNYLLSCQDRHLFIKELDL